jgi:TonB family protein
MKMKFKPQTEKEIKKTAFRAGLVIVLLLLGLVIFPQLQYAQTKLTLGDIFTALRSKKATLEERNKLLTDAIRARGITFSITTDIEKELEDTGAARELIDAIKQKSIVVKVAATPLPTPQPTPQATPSFEVFQKRGDSNFVKGEYDLAVVNYSKAIDLNPKEPSVYLSRGLVYYNRKFYDLAVADYSKVVEIDPKEMMAYYYRGDSFEKLGELQKAVDDFKKVVELDSSNDTAKANLQRLEAELSKIKPQPATVSPVTNAPAGERVKNTDAASAALPVPQFAELGSLIGFAVKLVQPNYPPNLRSMRIEGEVMVNITLDEEGNPVVVKAVSGHPILRQMCEDAIKRSKFRPATVNNQSTKARGFVTFKFRA